METCGKKFNGTCIGPPSIGEKFPCRGSVIATVGEQCASPQCDTTFQHSRPAFDKIVDATLVKIATDYEP
ncbi:hypothetical protein EUGRSUZ_C02445 [Eucalyptus grandis]|uniref:Uncharacterized protein n=2 Tax=Eucalyptus grandis TaxID=71139 RepID=A0ACC3LGQ8_EUCGR|nr:hypothetical protein EUGRSUZ_C02445 [Eucalyptus grandis]